MDESNHQIFLHKTFWCFAQTGCLTDITFQCKDMTMSAHRAILSATCKNLFSAYPGLATTIEKPNLILPDWTGQQVEQALHSLYAGHDPSQLELILGLDRGDGGASLAGQEWAASSPGENIESMDSVGPDQDIGSICGGEVEPEKLEKMSKVKCSYCDEQFKSSASLEIHERKFHLGEDIKKACEVCGQVVSKMKEHMLRKHPENLDTKQITNFLCPQCDYTTRIKSTLKQHIFNIHTERNLSCELCKYKTAIKSQLNQHKKKVHGIANIPCRFDGCPRKFVQECDLNDHIKRTHPTGFFNCHQCGKQFVNEEKMKRHIKMHNIDTEGLPCNICTLRFITKQKLREHMNTHTGATPYKCQGSGCEKAFMSSSSLSHHKKSCPSM